MIKAVFQIVAALVSWFLGRKQGPTSRKQVVDETNTSNRASAEIARETEQDIEHETDTAKSDTDDAADRVRDARSLRDGAETVDDAIGRANSRLRKP